MGHHRYITVRLAIAVYDPAPEGQTTPDGDIKKGLKDSLAGFKPKTKGKESSIKSVEEIT